MVKSGTVQLLAPRKKQDVIGSSTFDGRDLRRSNNTPTCFLSFSPLLSDSDMKMPLLFTLQQEIEALR